MMLNYGVVIYSLQRFLIKQCSRNTLNFNSNYCIAYNNVNRNISYKLHEKYREM